MALLVRSRDAVIAGAIGVGSFSLLVVNYWFPPEKIFDEVYFARAAEEYLQRRYIYESTHPPVTKLLITLSVILFGGLPAGDNSYGWRFLGVVAGAVAVVLTFLLARRVLRSTTFAAYAALLFACDGMHFVQFSNRNSGNLRRLLLACDALRICRYWDAVVAAEPGTAAGRNWAIDLGAFAVSAFVSIVFVGIRFAHESLAARIVATVAIAAALYAVYRLVRSRPAGAGWLLVFAFSGGLLVASKWYGIMAYGVAAVVIAYVSMRSWMARRASPFPIDTIVAVSIAAIAIVYTIAYIPHFVGLRDLQTLPPRPYTLTNVVEMQVGAYMYHAHLVATHPYASVLVDVADRFASGALLAKYGPGTCWPRRTSRRSAHRWSPAAWLRCWSGRTPGRRRSPLRFADRVVSCSVMVGSRHRR